LLPAHKCLNAQPLTARVRRPSQVFTMNVPESGVSSKAAASPALFNRCVLLFL
jgi:hypothetical protein